MSDRSDIAIPVTMSYCQGDDVPGQGVGGGAAVEEGQGGGPAHDGTLLALIVRAPARWWQLPGGDAGGCAPVGGSRGR
jgi:hypothetical protein